MHQQLLADQLGGRQGRVAVVLLSARRLLRWRLLLLRMVVAGELAADPGTRRGRAAAGTATAVSMRAIRDLKLICAPFDFRSLSHFPLMYVAIARRSIKVSTNSATHFGIFVITT